LIEDIHPEALIDLPSGFAVGDLSSLQLTPCGCAVRRIRLMQRSPRQNAAVWLCEYPGPSSPTVRHALACLSHRCSSRTMMSRKSSFTQSAHSVRRVLTAYNARPSTTVSRDYSSLFEAKRELSVIETPSVVLWFVFR
jgi:hypothetical protein